MANLTHLKQVELDAIDNLMTVLYKNGKTLDELVIDGHEFVFKELKPEEIEVIYQKQDLE
jgi:hypothetical protein